MKCQRTITTEYPPGPKALGGSTTKYNPNPKPNDSMKSVNRHLRKVDHTRLATFYVWEIQRRNKNIPAKAEACIQYKKQNTILTSPV